MTTKTQTIQAVNASFNKLLGQIESGALTSVSITKQVAPAVAALSRNNYLPTTTVVSKLVGGAAFDAANLLSGDAVVHTVSQLPYTSTPQQLTSEGLYKLTKQMDTINTIADDTSVKAHLSYRDSIASVNGINFTAKVAGAAGNSKTITVITGAALATSVSVNDVTITIVKNVTKFSDIVAAVNANGALPVTAAAAGVDDYAIVKTITSLTGGADPVAATLLTYRSGLDGINFTAKVAGVAGNSLTVVVNTGVALTAVQTGNNLVITLNTGVTIFSDIVTLITGYGASAVTATQVGSGATVATVFSVANLTLGADAVAATLATYRSGTNGILFTDLSSGTGGNNITVDIQDPGSNHALTVTVTGGNTVVVVLAYGGGVITSLVSDVITAINTTSGIPVLATLYGSGAATAVSSGGVQTAVGGTNGSNNFVAYKFIRAVGFSTNSAVAPTAHVRAVLISKAHADALGL